MGERYVHQKGLPNTKLFLLNERDTKSIAFDYISEEKNNGSQLSVEAETAIYEFVKYLIDRAKGI